MTEILKNIFVNIRLILHHRQYRSSRKYVLFDRFTLYSCKSLTEPFKLPLIDQNKVWIADCVWMCAYYMCSTILHCNNKGLINPEIRTNNPSCVKSSWILYMSHVGDCVCVSLYVCICVCADITQTNNYNYTENSTKHPLVVWEVNDGVWKTEREREKTKDEEKEKPTLRERKTRGSNRQIGRNVFVCICIFCFSKSCQN